MAGVEFVRCRCGAEWRHSINVLDGRPIWCPPKAKRGVPCKHEIEKAEALIDGEWVPVIDKLHRAGAS